MWLKPYWLTCHESYETESLCFIDILRGMSTYEIKLNATQNRRATKLRHAPTKKLGRKVDFKSKIFNLAWIYIIVPYFDL